MNTYVIKFIKGGNVTRQEQMVQHGQYLFFWKTKGAGNYSLKTGTVEYIPRLCIKN
jgi:hypothetical protein